MSWAGITVFNTNFIGLVIAINHSAASFGIVCDWAGIKNLEKNKRNILFRADFGPLEISFIVHPWGYA